MGIWMDGWMDGRDIRDSQPIDWLGTDNRNRNGKGRGNKKQDTRMHSIQLDFFQKSAPTTFLFVSGAFWNLPPDQTVSLLSIR